MNMLRMLVYAVVLFGIPLCHASAGELSRAERSLLRAFRLHKSGWEVRFPAAVIALLPTDNSGDRHQRFLVKLSSGQVLLIAHNIDIAPRVTGLRKNARVVIRGEYIWSKEGGVIHYTHHDPRGVHTSGWIQFDGRKFQ